MEFYQGLSPTDLIHGGGAYVRENGMGHEVCNFASHRGSVYGFVRPPSDDTQPYSGQIKIQRIDDREKGESSRISNVLVIWTATRPEGGTYVIGWYRDATVYRYAQSFKNPSKLQRQNSLKRYRIKTDVGNAVLLPVDQRTLQIPRQVKGGMGQANIWYAKSPDSSKIVSNVRALVGGRKTKKRQTKSRRTDPEHNAKVEKSAIREVRKHFQALGYDVESVERDNIGWDLEATAGRIKLRIEVKGLSGLLPAGELTPNEFVAFSENAPAYRLAIVTNSLKAPNLIICRYSLEAQGWIVDGHPTASVGIKQKTSATINIRMN